MYSNRELTRLATHKAALRRRIAAHRSEIAGAAARLARPVAWLDRVILFWRRIQPVMRYAVAPMALTAMRAVLPRTRNWPALFGRGVFVIGAVRKIFFKAAP